MLKGFALRFVYIVFFVIGAYAVHIYVSRTLDPHDYGIYSFCLSIITIAYIFLDNGVRQLVSRLVSRYPSKGKSFMKIGFKMQLIVSAIWGGGVTFGSGFIAMLFNNPSLRMPLFFSGIVIFVQGISFVFPGVFNGLKEFFKENFLMTTHAFTKPFFSIGLMLLGFGVSGALLGPLFSSLIAILMGLYFSANLKEESLETSENFSIKPLLKELFPIIIIFGCITLITNLDIIFVEYFCTDSNTVGYYSSAATISKSLYWFLTIIGAVLLPYISDLFFNKKVVKLKKVIVLTLKNVVIVSFPGVMLLSLNSPLFINLLFGSTYAESTKYLVGLSFVYWGVGFVSILSHIMIGLNREIYAMRVLLFGLTTFLIVNVILTSKFIGFGAIISSMISLIFILFTLLINLIRFVKTDGNASIWFDTLVFIVSNVLFIFLSFQFSNISRFIFCIVFYLLLELFYFKLKILRFEKF